MTTLTHPFISPGTVASLLVNEDEFYNGSLAGYLFFRVKYPGNPLTETDIWNLLMQTLLDVQHLDSWKAGYVTGWYAALFEHERPRQVPGATDCEGRP
jgi:hypothetical protein